MKRFSGNQISIPHAAMLKLRQAGKLNLGINNKNLEMEQMKLKNFRNNVVISFFGIVIVFLLVF